MNGFLLMNKPEGMTSREVVNRIVRLKRRLKIGHAGTLDPMATGLLVIALGKATRLVDLVQDHLKCYRACFVLGATSNTDDATGQLTQVNQQYPSQETVAELEAIHGEILQVPPRYSAVHVEGKRAYDLARSGVEFSLKPKQVWIERIRIERYSPPNLEVTIECGSGTYIRSLGRDWGELWGCGGYMSSLVRESIGPFALSAALTLEELDQSDWSDRLLPMAVALPHIPELACTPDEILRLKHGGKLRNREGLAGGRMKVLSDAGELVALVEVVPNHCIRPTVVLEG